MAGILDTILGGLTKQYDIAMPAVNFVRGLALGPKEALMTPSMQLDLARRAENKGGDKGALGYEDFGLEVAKPMGRFTGGLFSLDPTTFANVGSVGRVTYEKDPTQFGGYKYGNTEFNFTPDKDTGSTGNKILDFINEGGLAKKIADSNLSKTLSNLVFTPAYGDIPTKEEREGLDSFNYLVSDTVMAEPNQFQDFPGVENLGSVQNVVSPYEYTFNPDVLKEEEDAQYNLPEKSSIFSNILDAGLSYATGIPFVGKGLEYLINQFSNTPKYQRYTPGYNYGNLNPNLIDDFYDPATGLNRFDRAKTLFGQSRTLSEYLSKRRERAAAEAESQRIDAANRANVQSYIDSGGQSYDSQAQGTMYSDASSLGLE